MEPVVGCDADWQVDAEQPQRGDMAEDRTGRQDQLEHAAPCDEVARDGRGHSDAREGAAQRFPAKARAADAVSAGVGVDERFVRERFR